MWIPDETIDAIRSQSNIVEIISEYVQLKKQGQNYFASCPFHEDRSPSFSVQEEKMFYHCFSCKRGGNVFNFIQEIEGITFPEAVIKVAELSGVVLDESILNQSLSQKPKKDSLSAQLIQVHEEASRFYHQVLTQTQTGEKALAYLHERDLTDETIQEFQLGYSPSQRGALADYLKGKIKDISHDVLVQSALFIETQEKELLDRFSNRIIFPITNHQSETIAFSGRHVDLEDDVLIESSGHRPAKYVNSTDTPIFNKSDILYNFSKARAQVRRQEEIYLFEGYMDVIAAWQAGLQNGVASMGTSLTESQMKQIEKLTDKIIIAYDGDAAGLQASHRALGLLSKEYFDLELVLFPNESDPDDFIQKRGSESFLDLMHHGRLTPMGFYLQYYRQNKNLNNESELLEYIDKALKEMVHVASAVEREVYLKQIADEFDLTMDSLKDQLSQIISQHRHQKIQEKYQHKNTNSSLTQTPTETYYELPDRYEKAENIILHRLFDYPEEVYRMLDYAEDFHFYSDSAQVISLLFQEFINVSDHLSTSKFIDFLQEKSLKERVAQIEMMTLSDEFNENEIQECIYYIQSNNLHEQLENAKTGMEKASQQGDIEKQEEYLIKIVELTRQID